MTTALTKPQIIQREGDAWRILQKGASRNGKTFCHLASTTKGKQQRNGFYPVQMCDWIDNEELENVGAE